ncbi:MAG TPA: lamin tail domain-containing protein, partial [Verrucomicrobiales bacterium]|nr:lamin tail domain-containing protein [Verrucomicrobiales bacterium]
MHRLLFLCCAVIAPALPPASAQPVITEFMADNASGLADAAGRHSDWIEIHNPGGTPQDMTGWHLTDNASTLTKWTFPAVSIPAGGRLVVFASGDGVPDTGGALHTNFSLDAGGEYLALVAPDGVTKSSEFAPYPPQREDVSYGVARTRTEVISPGSAGRAAAASASITGDWRGGSEPYPDNTWMAVTNGIGYNRADQPVLSLPSPVLTAWQVPAGTVGNQNYGGALGMDFSAERPLTVTARGAFDSGSNGFAQPIRVQLWTRDEHSTPDNFSDDTG